jgi:hypothetical protein
MHRESDVFEVAVRCGRCRLEAGEAVEAAHFTKPMNDDKVADGFKNRIVVRVPRNPGQGFGVK